MADGSSTDKTEVNINTTTHSLFGKKSKNYTVFVGPGEEKPPIDQLPTGADLTVAGWKDGKVMVSAVTTERHWREEDVIGAREHIVLSGENQTDSFEDKSLLKRTVVNATLKPKSQS